MKTFPQPLNAREEREYLKRYQEGDLDAREVLIHRNMRLVAHVIKKYQSPDYEMEDLLSVGTIGLIKAVNTFNPDKGSRLATYAAKCVENAILSQMRLWFPIDCPSQAVGSTMIQPTVSELLITCSLFCRCNDCI